MDNYRMSTRGNQRYVMPKVGSNWTPAERATIRMALEVAGYFVTSITPGRLSVSETSKSPGIEEAETYIEGA
jgi:hypothetical protein